ncbi:MAG: MarR family transcriptional regulator [Candidatus Lokiarchaeota archaeon]|nr:MarR family transcriptional regulator [Candidatus Lokiarchaeota archaeon]MBD3198744.1 MarR family transcriptional regulator [Candidatus Lokiarchaeota archaeon]
MQMDKKIESIINQLSSLFETVATSSVLFQNLNISFAELRTLLFIIKSNTCVMSDLTGFFKIAPSTATGIIDRLVDYGYISRERSKNDRRKVILEATEKAINFRQNHQNLRMKEMSKIFNSLSSEKRDDLIKALHQVNEILRETSLCNTNKPVK